VELEQDKGAITAEKLRGTKVWVPTPGGLAPRARPKAELGVGCGRWSLEGKGVLPPENFFKTLMLNPAFL